jgi:hypothetical protein
MFKIIEINFLNRVPWIFKLTSTSGDVCYIMNAEFYKQNGMASPITKKELDDLDVGHTLTGEVQEISGLIVLTKIA